MDWCSVGGAVRTRATVEEGITVDTGWRDGGFRLVEYQPGNGYRYVVAFQKLLEAVGSDRLQERMGLPKNAAVVTWLYENKCVVLSLDSDLLHWSYLQEKLRCSEQTAVVLAELFAFILPERTAVTSEQWLEDQVRKESGAGA